MKTVLPHELLAGAGRGMAVCGRVCAMNFGPIKKKHHCEIHLVCEAGHKGTLLISAWRDNARRLQAAATPGSCITVTSLDVYPIGDRRRYQFTDLDVYGSVSASTTFENADPALTANVPAFLPLVSVSLLQKYVLKGRQVNVAGNWQSMETEKVTATQRSVATAWLVCGDKRIKVSVWQESLASAKRLTQGNVIAVTRAVPQRGPQDSTELQTTRSTDFLEPPETIRREVIAETPTLDNSALTQMSHVYTRKDFATAPAKRVLLSSLVQMLVPGAVRDLDGLYEVHHCLLQGVEPFG